MISFAVLIRGRQKDIASTFYCLENETDIQNIQRHNVLANHWCPVNQKVYPLRGKVNLVYTDLQYFILYAENSP